MHVGLSVMFQALEAARTDSQMYADNLSLADTAEARGFDSIWTAEHHFTDYVVSPNPMQFLTYMAGRTQHALLGSMVMVLPWHDPVRVAEEVSVLDTLSNGRVVLGFGRGLGPIEFDGFRVEMGESRQRFTEYAAAISDALESGSIAADGPLYHQPKMDIRPRPPKSFRGRIYASSVSPESARIMARLGFGIMIIAQKPWDTTYREINEYRELYREVNGEEPPKPILVNFCTIAESTAEVEALHSEFALSYSRSSISHYDFLNEKLATVNGYEYYAKLRERIEKHGVETFAKFLADLQIAGTPEQIVEQTVERVRALDAAGVVNVFKFGGMPIETARRSLDLYTERVLPRLREVDTHRAPGVRGSRVQVA